MHLALKSAMSRIPYTNKVGETLGSIADSAAAYSLRALNGGDPMVARVRRSSDDAEKDFTASDVSGGALVDWVGSVSDGFVTSWYDQSGNDNHATQSTASSQPKIVDGGTLVSNGIEFDGVDDTLELTTTFSMSGTSIFAVSKDTGGTFNAIIGGRDGLSNQRVFRTYNQNDWRAVNSTDGFDFYKGGKLFVNGQDGATTSFSATSLNLAFAYSSSFPYNYDSISTNAQTRVWNGVISEIIVYDSDQSANRAAIETNINNYYDIY